MDETQTDKTFTFLIDPELKRQAKIKSATINQPIGPLLVAYLQAWVNEPIPESEPAAPRIQTVEFTKGRKA